ncbi:penicillin-binding protein 2 [Haliovirga abyssi]|uniref:Cell division protein FtsI n=1 Tax=Haliovirga abyssi TaxID=2996794 RepID=A0AAU9D5R0_9FUSO|nr:penicillin-binding protein 2 [Haliovirga abyssi]BDU49893.1 cell division protein FtsI [Haliovirga abyssi]
MKLNRENDTRVYIFIGFVILFFTILLIRLFFMQVVEWKYYKKLSKNNRTKIREIEAPRGKIYDRNGKLLVTNVAGYKLVYLNKRKYTPEILKKIGEILNRSQKQIIKLIKNGYIYGYTGENVLVEDLNRNIALKLMENIDNFPYLDVITYPKRKYLYNDLASHVLGYIRSINTKEFDKLRKLGYNQGDKIGKKGIEKKYENLLKGKNGLEYIEVNALNKLVNRLDTNVATPGKDLKLSIDIELEKDMSNYLKGKKAAFIAMEAKTGRIITFVSSPGYDLNKFTGKMTQKEWNSILKNPNRPLENRGSVGTYPPGSIFKPIVAMAVLNSGISPDKTIFDPGYYKIGKWRWNDWKLSGHGIVNLEDAIVHSCDTYFYTMGDKIGYKKIVDMSKQFGIGRKTGIDIPEERAGNLPDEKWKRRVVNEPWYGGDTINLSIGQGYLTTTPLQMLEAYDILANKGVGYKPHFVEEIDGKEVKKVIKYKVNLKKEYFDIINLALRKVVKEGTAANINMKNIEIAGKTGSAENSHYKITHAWFAGFAPYDNPEIVFVSFIEGGGHGGSHAAPAAKEFVKKYFENRMVK